MKQPRILVLPSGMPASIRYARTNKDYQYLVGASSNRFEPARNYYHEHYYLPHVSDENFLSALQDVVREQAIDGIVCQHQVVWSFIKNADSNDAPPLLNPAPIPALLSPYRESLVDSARFIEYLKSLYSHSVAPSDLQMAGLLKHFDDIPGECDHDKLLLFLIAAAVAPQGDFVEIGSLWGKSAYVLAWLAQFYETGTVLCIDPWSKTAAEQKSRDDQLVRLSSATHDISEGLLVFCQNLLATGLKNINFLRMLSYEAVNVYRASKTVESTAFGKVDYAQTIALLHIDGNHDLDVVQRDIHDWCGMVIPGGWIIIDDYTWKFGEGPKIAGDSYLIEHSDMIDCAFVMGGALAIRKRF